MAFSKIDWTRKPRGMPTICKPVAPQPSRSDGANGASGTSISVPLYVGCLDVNHSSSWQTNIAIARVTSEKYSLSTGRFVSMSGRCDSKVILQVECIELRENNERVAIWI